MSNVIVIKPGLQERNYWRDLWRYRELFYVLAWRDVAVRYKQTVIGAAWALIRPLLTMVVFTVVFGRIAKLPSEGAAPYPLMVFAGILPWTFFSSWPQRGIEQPDRQCQPNQQGLLPALDCPDCRCSGGVRRFSHRLHHPTGDDGMVSFCAGLADSGIAGFRPAVLPRQHRAGPVDCRAERQVPRFPLHHPLLAAAWAVCFAGGVQRQIVPPKWQLLYALNPMVGIIEGFRWCILGGEQSSLYPASLTVSFVVAGFFLWFGIRRFRKTEKSFADLI